MPRIEVGDGNLTGPDGKDVPVKVIVAESVDGISTQIVIAESVAKEVAAALDGRKIQVAQPEDMPKEEPDGTKS